MFIAIKKDYNENNNNIQVKILGVFSNIDDAFNIAQAHSNKVFDLIDINDEKNDTWQVEYNKHNHKYQIIIYKIDDNIYDEIEILNTKIPNTLGYSFTW